MTDSADRIRSLYAGYSGLYAPSVVDEAAALLDELMAVAEKHGHGPDSWHLGGLVSAAAEATSSKYGHRRDERASAELAELTGYLSTAFVGAGLKLAPSRVRMGVAAEPMPGGKAWGIESTGLAVAIYSDSGWELMVNQSQTRAFTIHAPATADGAAEVAVLVRGVLDGSLPDPFARR